MINYDQRNRWLKQNGFRSYNDYLQSRHWLSFRLSILERRGRECERCSSTDRIQIHHKTYARIGHEHHKDVLVLCRKCHEDEHLWLQGKLAQVKKVKPKKSLCCGAKVKGKQISKTQWRIVCVKCGKRQHRVRRKLRIENKKRTDAEIKRILKDASFRAVDLNETANFPVKTYREKPWTSQEILNIFW